MNLKQYFLAWSQKHLLGVAWLDDFSFTIVTVGKFFLLDNGKQNVVNSNGCFNLTKLQKQQLLTGYDYIVFLFGGEFFYASANFVTVIEDDKIYKRIIFDCIPFKYLGTAAGAESQICFVHEEYELFNGAFIAADWVKKAKFLGCTALAICSKNTLAGTLAFQLECQKKDIKPLLGMTISICYDLALQKNKYISDTKDEALANFIPEIYEGVVFANTRDGWRNLLRINTEINVNNVQGAGDGKSTYILSEDLFAFATGITFIFGTNSKLLKHIGKKATYAKEIARHKEVFDYVYYQFDFTRFADKKYDAIHLQAKQFYLENFYNKLPVLLMHDAYFLEREQSVIKRDFNDIGRVRTRFSEDYFFAPFDVYTQAIRQLFKTGDARLNNLLLDGIVNLQKFIIGCNFAISVGQHKLPKFPLAKNIDKTNYFIGLCVAGLERKILAPSKKYINRLEHELSVVIEAGFMDYFLVTHDFVKWAKKNDILVGNGRGSVGGSLLAYVLDITTIDPIKYDLMFERFLNEARVSGERAKSADAIPDIDIDFQGTKRDDVKRYLEQKYGQDNVCSVGTYGRFKVKAGLKDFGRLAGLNFQYVNQVTRYIPNGIDTSYKALINYAMQNEALKIFLKKNPNITRKLGWVINQAHHFSVHASAVIIAPRENEYGEKDLRLQDWLPVRKLGGQLVSEWEGKYLDKAGFLKEDLLGIAQLDKFKAILDLVRANTGIKIVLEDIPLDDEKVFEYFKKGWNEDVFQFGTEGLKNYCRQVKPDDLEDLIAMNALFRPGAMSSNAHKLYAEIKHGEREPEYDAGMEQITNKTFGLMIYQEQIMQALTVAGFSLVEADEIRTAIKKFDKIKMGSIKDKFVINYTTFLKKNKINDKQYAIRVWEKLMAFSLYGFNRCITGDTLIYRFTGNQYYTKELTIKQLYDFEHISGTDIYTKFKKQGHLGLVRYYNPENGKVQMAKVKTVHFNGKKKVFCVMLENGMSIKVTKNHRLMKSDESYSTIQNLKIGDELMVCGDKNTNFNEQIRNEKYGNGWTKFFKGNVCPKTQKVIIDGRSRKFKLVKKAVLHRANNKCENCSKDAGGRMEFHHVDGNHFKDTPKNVMYVCNPCHKKLDYKIGRRTSGRNLGYLAQTSKISSIEYVGVEDTFDLEMMEEPHNFIANGIVSHNSHSAAYAITAYHCQWLKVNYPIEFWTVSLNFAQEKEIPKRLSEIDRLDLGLKLLPPDINRSTVQFTCDPKRRIIYYSLSKIKGVGEACVQEILLQRNIDQYDSMIDFVKRVAKSKVNKAKVQALILAGAFDELEGAEQPQQRLKIINDYFAIIGSAPPALPADENYYVQVQRALTGFGDIDYEKYISPKFLRGTVYLSAQAFAQFKPKAAKFANKLPYHTICGTLLYLDVKPSKRGDFARLILINNNERIEGILWNDVYGKIKDIVSLGKTYAMKVQIKVDSYSKQNRFYSGYDTEIKEIKLK